MQMRFHGQLATLAQMTTRGAWELDLPHDRPHGLLVWITRGQAVGMVRAARRGFGAHNLIYVPPRQLFSISFGRQCFGLALRIDPQPGGFWPEAPRHLRVRDVQDQARLTAFLEGLGREQPDQPAAATARAAWCDLIAVWQHRAAEVYGGVPGRDSAADRLRRAFSTRLADHHRDGVSMADHAAALGVTPTHLSRVIRKASGQTAADLLTGRVVHAARLALIDTDAPVRAVAKSLGFSSAAYFSRFMQANTGLTPTLLRQHGAGR